MKRIEAWVVVNGPGSLWSVHGRRVDALESANGQPNSIVRLVPYDAREKAVVRAARAWWRTRSENFGTLRPGVDDEALALFKAMWRLETKAVAKLNRRKGKK